MSALPWLDSVGTFETVRARAASRAVAAAVAAATSTAPIAAARLRGWDRWNGCERFIA
jgi:hypothetical protein